MAKVAFITGASRGIGKSIALKLAQEGWDIVIASRSIKDRRVLPGTIYSAAKEVQQFGTKVIAIQCDITNDESVVKASKETLSQFGRIDAVINNSGAIWIENVDNTPMDRIDQVMDTNFRGAYAVTRSFLPTMKKQGSGHIIMMSPPIHIPHIGNKIAYMVSKYGMTMMVFGLTQELKGTGISATALWPKTYIKSQATINFKLGDPSIWREPTIVADTTFQILQHPQETNGQSIIDEPFLRSKGIVDFDKYLCQPDGKPQDLPF